VYRSFCGVQCLHLRWSPHDVINQRTITGPSKVTRNSSLVYNDMVKCYENHIRSYHGSCMRRSVSSYTINHGDT
jgi:hypothetical protein